MSKSGHKKTKRELLNIVLDIKDLLSGKQWNPQTLENIADILRNEGFEIQDFDESEQDVFGCTCGVEIPATDNEAIDQHIAECDGWPPEEETLCCECGQPLGESESMVRNDGRMSHLDECPK